MRREIDTVRNVSNFIHPIFNKIFQKPPSNNEGNLGDTRIVRQGLRMYTYVKTEKGWQRNVFEKNPTATAATAEAAIGTDVPTITNFAASYTQESGGPQIVLSYGFSNATGVTNQKLRRRKRAGGSSSFGNPVIWNGSSWVTDSTSVVSIASNASNDFTDTAALGLTNSGGSQADTFLYTLEAQYGASTVGPEAVQEDTGVIFVGITYSQSITYTETGSGVTNGDVVTAYWSDGKLIECASKTLTPTDLDTTSGQVAYNATINEFNIYGDFDQNAFGLNTTIYTNTALNSAIGTGSKYTREGLGQAGAEPSIYKTNSSGTTTFYRGAFPNAITSVALQGSPSASAITIRITANTQVTNNFIVYKRVYNGSWDAGSSVTPSAKGNAANTSVVTDYVASGLASSTRFDFKVVAQGLADSTAVEVSNANLTTTGTPSPGVSVSPSSVQHANNNTEAFYYSDVVTVAVTNGAGSIFIQGVPQSNTYHIPQYRVASSSSDKITSGGTWITASTYVDDASSTITPNSGTVYVQFRSQLSYKASIDQYRDGVATFNFKETTSSGTDTDSTVAGIRWAAFGP